MYFVSLSLSRLNDEVIKKLVITHQYLLITTKKIVPRGTYRKTSFGCDL